MTTLASILHSIATKAAENANRVVIHHDVVEQLRAEGIALEDHNMYDIRFGCSINVPREALPTVRKIVGRIKVESKDLAYDFDETREVIVRVKPVDESFPVTFDYRAKYRAGGKCEVHESVTPARVHKSLVCKV